VTEQPNRSQRAKTIFMEALNYDSLELRNEYLNRACAEAPELREEFDELLTSLKEAGSLLESRPASKSFDETLIPEASGPSSATSRPGDVIGSYKLLEEIGEGGMGTVWVAQQSRPINRKVAIKLIKAGMDSQQVLARFEAERQALAMMDHPNIARVLDGGMTEQGRPYFAMEYVKGVPLTEYCDQAKLSLKERLELFLPICNAVQHAHQKGIIHRDLKPSNILICLYDGAPVPKVIDFGLAKAMHHSLTEQSLHTAHGMMVGTPLYMSPEQAESNNLDIDTRTDIYSLGVILYELLTGSTPLEKAEIKQAVFNEVLRLIKEVEPPRPSTRLSGSETLPSVAAQRSIEPAQLTRSITGDLDWVVMKALEKDRRRRYETANGLAEDIRRHLADEPVSASPPSTHYRMQKFFKRNRAGVIAASAVALALLLGVAGTTTGLMQANVQRRLAERRATEAEAARAAEVEQRRRAEQAGRQAFAALESFTSDLMIRLLGSRSELTDTEKRVLENALSQWEVFAESKGTSSEARWIRAEGAANVATIQYRLGMAPKAEINDRKAVTIREELAAEFPNNERYQRGLATAHQNLGATLRSSGKREEAGQHFRRAAEIREILVAKFPDEPEYLERLARTCISVANSARDFGRFDESESQYKKALSIRETLLILDPDSETYQEGLARSHWGLAYIYDRQLLYAEAEGHYREAIRIYESLQAAAPKSLPYRQNLGSLHRELGVTLFDSGNHQDGAEELALALSVLESIVVDFPSIPDYRLDVARVRVSYASVLRRQERFEDSATQCARAIDTLEQLVTNHPTVLPYQLTLGRSFNCSGELSCDQGKFEESLVWYGKAIQTLKSAYVQDRGYTLVRAALCTAHESRANSLDQLNRHSEGLPDRDEAFQLRQEMLARHPDDVDTLNAVAWRSVTVPDKDGRYPQAEQAVQWARRANELSPDNGALQNTLGVALYRAEQWREAIDSLQQSTKRGFDVPHNWLFIAMAHWQLDEKGKAKEWYEKSLSWQTANGARAIADGELRGFFTEAAMLMVPTEEKQPDEKPAESAPANASDNPANAGRADRNVCTTRQGRQECLHHQAG